MSQISKDIPTLKCLIMGHTGCGKTSLIQRLLTGSFDQNYKPTKRAEESRLTIYTNRGPICFKVWETAASSQEELYNHVQCVIILYDVSSADSYNAVPKLVNNLVRVCPKLPMAVCGSKFDLVRDSSKLWNMNVELLLLSVKLRHNLVNPFLLLAKKIFGDANLRMVPMPAQAPPYAPIAKDEQLRMLRELPWPPKEDDDDN